MGDALAPPPRSSFARYWTAAAVSSFGSAVTAVAMPVLVVQLLGATPFEVGVVNAAQFVPYALLGLIAGVYTDRWRRKPVLVWASVGRALSLGVIPVLWLIGVLQIWILVVALLLFGAFSVFRVRRDPVAASSPGAPGEIGSGQCAARSSRRRCSGSRASDRRRTRRAAGSPCGDTVDAISYLIDAALNASIRVDEP